MTNYIFCPRCAHSEWLANKAKQAEGGTLNIYQCNTCHNFTYTEHCEKIEPPSKVLYGGYFSEVKPYEVDVVVGDYRVVLYFFRQATHFMDRLNNDKVVLMIGQIIDFNWYLSDAYLLEKIKLYLTFS